MSVGQTITVSSVMNADVINVGSSIAAVLDFQIRQGKPGPIGPTGSSGSYGSLGPTGSTGPIGFGAAGPIGLTGFMGPILEQLDQEETKVMLDL